MNFWMIEHYQMKPNQTRTRTSIKGVYCRFRELIQKWLPRIRAKEKEFRLQTLCTRKLLVIAFYTLRKFHFLFRFRCATLCTSHVHSWLHIHYLYDIIVHTCFTASGWFGYLLHLLTFSKPHAQYIVRNGKKYEHEHTPHKCMSIRPHDNSTAAAVATVSLCKPACQWSIGLRPSIV